MNLSDRAAALVYIVLFGSTNVAITLHAGTVKLSYGLTTGAMCILFWLLFMGLYRAELRRQRGADPLPLPFSTLTKEQP